MKDHMKICIVLGTRPEIIKMSPVIRECQRRRLRFFVVHTNQHYDASLDAVFFRELRLPKPRYNLNVGSKPRSRMIIEIKKRLLPILKKEQPSVVLVQGDTNSVLAGAQAAYALKMPVGHVEAGLRSFDKTMPEELNRFAADRLAAYLFAPTKVSAGQLRKEKFPAGKIYSVGNTIVDAVRQNLALAKRKSRILARLGLKKSNYAFLTLHRPATVDDKVRLAEVLAGLGGLSELGLDKIIFSLHPRTEKNLKKFNLKLPPNIFKFPPLPYLDTLALVANSRLVLTDSGGLQEEACVLRVKCVTLRKNTERPETLKVGGNILAGQSARRIVRAAGKMLKKKVRWVNPFGRGDAAVRIVGILQDKLHPVK